jgi:NADH-quinone oxidoreductase subunit C
MNFHEIKEILSNKFGDNTFLEINQKSNQPILQIGIQQLIEVCKFLYEDERLFFDYLVCLTGIDNGLEKGTVDVLYNLTSIPYQHNLTIKVTISRQIEGYFSTIPTLSNIWKTANWHEREAFDLVGIYFEGHPDFRRILLPSDWHGYPLRKDYQEQDLYHGIKVTY